MTTWTRLIAALLLAPILATAPLAQAQTPRVPVPRQMQTPPITRLSTTFISDTPTIAARCPSGLRTAQVDISTTLHPNPGQLTGGAPLVDILVDGTAIGAQPATSRLLNPINPQGGAAVDVRRTLTLPGPGGTHTLQFVLNRTYRSNVQTISFSCLQVQNPQAAPIAYPDIGFDTSTIGVFYEPSEPAAECHRQGLEQCPILPSQYDFQYGELPARTIFFTDPTHISILALNRAVGACPASGDMLVTVDFVIPVTTSRMDLAASREVPLDLFNEGHWYYQGSPQTLHHVDGARYIDTRQTRQEARPGTMAFPLGHQWLWFQRQLPCTSDAILTFTLDPNNRLRESDETNNTLRFHYRTR